MSSVDTRYIQWHSQESVMGDDEDVGTEPQELVDFFDFLGIFRPK